MSWVCPHCNVAAILNDENFISANFNLNSRAGFLSYELKGVACPNPDCFKPIVTMRTDELANLFGQLTTINNTRKYTRIIPAQDKERAKSYPSYIPVAIICDYSEACAIVDLSPKSSATLARRALQGMIRDFWGVSEENLSRAIKAIEDKVSSDIWEAIDGIRQVGNIGAHMEKDINLIIDVSPEEADLLIEMIEMLLDDWYVARYNRQQKLQRIKDVVSDKKEARKG